MASNNANKSIKDLRELNEKLKNQKFQAEAREWTLNRRNQELKEQIEMLVKDDEKSQETIIELSNRIDKAIKHIETHQLCYQSQYEEMSGFDNHLLDILRGEDNEKV